MNDCPFDFPITYEGYKALHRHIFQDVYEWAGQSRKVTIHKGDAFANWMYVDQEMKKRFVLLQNENGLKGLKINDFCARAAEHINEINAIHPFRDGNGRTQRLFLKNTAFQAGHELEIRKIDRDIWMNACIVGFRQQNYDPMERCIQSAMSESRPLQKMREDAFSRLDKQQKLISDKNQKRDRDWER